MSSFDPGGFQPTTRSRSLLSDSGYAFAGATRRGDYQSLQTAALIAALGGLATQAIGSYYAVDAQRYQLQSQALSADFEQSMANLNARAAEQDAEAILQAGQREAAFVGMQYGQAKSARRAGQAARGIQAGVGSAAEELASTELASQIDRLTINANAVRAAHRARAQAVDFRNRGLLAGVSASNLRRSAGSLSPWLAAGTSLLGGAGLGLQQWAQAERTNVLYRSRLR